MSRTNRSTEHPPIEFDIVHLRCMLTYLPKKSTMQRLQAFKFELIPNGAQFRQGSVDDKDGLLPTHLIERNRNEPYQKHTLGNG